MSDDRYSFPCITDVSQTFLRNPLRDRILELLPCGLCKLWLSMSIGNLKPFAEALGLEDGTLMIILRAAGCIVRSDDKDEWVQGVFKKIIPIQHEIRKHNNIRYLRFKLTDGCELNTQSTPVAFENSCPEDNYQPKYKVEFEAVREQ
jgi:hypothetical protein